MSDPRWLVSRPFDLFMFGVPALVALLLVPLGPLISPSGALPLPMWWIAVLAVDVAHVWATLYVTYLDRQVWKGRRTHLVAAPLGVLAACALVLFGAGWEVFWTGLAYLAVFHFVRQQAGWMALYHRNDPELGRGERYFDIALIYGATIYPLLWWHAHLPRGFAWMVDGDFLDGAALRPISDVLFYPYLILIAGWLLVQARGFVRGRGRPGKVLLGGTTAACWGVGIIATNTDWAFTVTNVLIHGVPYFGWVWVRSHRPGPGAAGFAAALAAFYGLLFGIAVLEEWAWDRAVWGEGAWSSEPWVLAATAVLAVPQVTHYVLDGVIWKRRFREGLPA